MKLLSLILTLINGILVFLGSMLGKKIKKNKKILNFSITVIVGIITSVLIFKMIPNYFKVMLKEVSLFKTIICLAILLVIGIIILEIIHVFSPHKKYNKTSENNNEYFKHIGIMISSTFFLYNIINGINLYELSSVIICVLIGLLNIIIGIIIYIVLSNTKLPKNNILKLCLFISLAPFIGGLIYIIFDGISNLMMGILLGINIGMLIYILLFELLVYIKHIRNKKILKIGIIFGTLLSFISIIIELIIR